MGNNLWNYSVCGKVIFWEKFHTLWGCLNFSCMTKLSLSMIYPHHTTKFICFCRVFRTFTIFLHVSCTFSFLFWLKSSIFQLKILWLIMFSKNEFVYFIRKNWNSFLLNTLLRKLSPGGGRRLLMSLATAQQNRYIPLVYIWLTGMITAFSILWWIFTQHYYIQQCLIITWLALYTTFFPFMHSRLPVEFKNTSLNSQKLVSLCQEGHLTCACTLRRYL